MSFYREITLIGGSSHGKEFGVNDEAGVVINNKITPPFADIEETYTVCQLRSGQWVGYIAIEKELV